MERAIDSTSSKTSAGTPAARGGERLVDAAGEKVHELAFLLDEGVHAIS
ncbi:hypothetical protein [Rhodococcus qingshengii]